MPTSPPMHAACRAELRQLVGRGTMSARGSSCSTDIEHSRYDTDTMHTKLDLDPDALALTKSSRTRPSCSCMQAINSGELSEYVGLLTFTPGRARRRVTTRW